MLPKKKKFYVVWAGLVPGIYKTWNECKIQIDGYPGARYKGYFDRISAEKAFQQGPDQRFPPKKIKSSTSFNGDHGPLLQEGKIVIYTDGSALNNPGPGGYGAVILNGENRVELSGGFRKTTNNRMEMLAAIKALAHIQSQTSIVLFTDSKYIVDSVTKGWAQRWKSKGWFRTKDQYAENRDLWATMLTLIDSRKVEFRWVKGHAGIPENERCDELATSESGNSPRAIDTFFEDEKCNPS